MAYQLQAAMVSEESRLISDWHTLCRIVLKQRLLYWTLIRPAV